MGEDFNSELGSVGYYLKEPNSNESTLIIGKYLFKKTISTFTTGVKVLPTHWNSDEKIVKSGKEKKAINEKLAKLKLNVIQAHKNFNESYQRLPSKEELRSLVKQAVDGSETKAIKKGKKTFEDVYNEVMGLIELKNQNAIEASKKGENTKVTDKSYSSSIRVAYNDLKTFAKEKNVILDIDTFDETVCLEFQHWLINVKGLKLSTIGTRVKRVGHILKRAFERGYTNNRSYLLDEFKVKVPPTISTSLTEDEITLLYQFDFSQNKSLERVRDTFVLACHTGLRFETVTRLQLDHVDIENKNVKILVSKSSKTHSYKYANFKFFGYAEEILKKYNYDILSIAISNQKTNTILNKVFESIPHFRDKIISQEVPTNKGVKFVKHKFLDLIDFHTSRRSFCTNRYCEGWDLLQIWDYTTHSDEFTFKTYFRPTPEHERIRKENIRKRSEKLREIDFKEKQLENLQRDMQEILELHKKGELDKVGKIIELHQKIS